MDEWADDDPETFPVSGSLQCTGSSYQYHLNLLVSLAITNTAMCAASGSVSPQDSSRQYSWLHHARGAARAPREDGSDDGDDGCAMLFCLLLPRLGFPGGWKEEHTTSAYVDSDGTEAAACSLMLAWSENEMLARGRLLRHLAPGARWRARTRRIYSDTQMYAHLGFLPSTNEQNEVVAVSVI